MSPVTPLVGSDRDWDASPEEVDDTGADEGAFRPEAESSGDAPGYGLDPA
jgi:hypothetical protein